MITEEQFEDWKMSQETDWVLKTLFGILFNLVGSYLLFFPQTYFIFPSKITGVLVLLFSYYIFYWRI